MTVLFMVLCVLVAWVLLAWAGSRWLWWKYAKWAGYRYARARDLVKGSGTLGLLFVGDEALEGKVKWPLFVCCLLDPLFFTGKAWGAVRRMAVGGNEVLGSGVALEKGGEGGALSDALSYVRSMRGLPESGEWAFYRCTEAKPPRWWFVGSRSRDAVLSLMGAVVVPVCEEWALRMGSGDVPAAVLYPTGVWSGRKYSREEAVADMKGAAVEARCVVLWATLVRSLYTDAGTVAAYSVLIAATRTRVPRGAWGEFTYSPAIRAAWALGVGTSCFSPWASCAVRSHVNTLLHTRYVMDGGSRRGVFYTLSDGYCSTNTGEFKELVFPSVCGAFMDEVLGGAERAESFHLSELESTRRVAAKLFTSSYVSPVSTVDVSAPHLAGNVPRAYAYAMTVGTPAVDKRRATHRPTPLGEVFSGYGASIDGINCVGSVHLGLMVGRTHVLRKEVFGEEERVDTMALPYADEKTLLVVDLAPPSDSLLIELGLHESFSERAYAVLTGEDDEDVGGVVAEEGEDAAVAAEERKREESFVDSFLSGALPLPLSTLNIRPEKNTLGKLKKLVERNRAENLPLVRSVGYPAFVAGFREALLEFATVDAVAMRRDIVDYYAAGREYAAEKPSDLET